ncbi:MAG: DUF4272 domain-containing protein [Acidobacteria bacterium]|nr:DUF4272 domain-containing protein [Acidobacteriota bacterium]
MNQGTQNTAVRKPEAVAQRIVCLGLLFLRGEIEQNMAGASSDGARKIHRDTHARLYEWTRQGDLHKWFHPAETLEWELPLGQWLPATTIRTSWLPESNGTLLWALGRLAHLPPIEEVFDVLAIVRKLPLLQDPAPFLQAVALRPLSELEQAFRVMDIWHWRAQVDAAIRGELTPPDDWTWPKIIRVTLDLAHEEGVVPAPLDDDLACFGKPYRDLEPAQRRFVASVSTERLRALAWVLGRVEQWGDLPTSSVGAAADATPAGSPAGAN